MKEKKVKIERQIEKNDKTHTHNIKQSQLLFTIN